MYFWLYCYLLSSIHLIKADRHSRKLNFYCTFWNSFVMQKYNRYCSVKSLLPWKLKYKSVNGYGKPFDPIEIMGLSNIFLRINGFVVTYFLVEMTALFCKFKQFLCIFGSYYCLHVYSSLLINCGWVLGPKFIKMVFSSCDLCMCKFRQSCY